MVGMSNSGLLVERKPTYSEVLKNSAKSKNSMTKDSGRYLNGDISFFGRQERSNSECSSDSQLDTLLEAADKIKDGKRQSFEKPKKRVRFNMDKNEKFTYSYSNYNESLDTENGKSGSNGISNINFGFEYMNGNDESDDDDDDDDDNDDDDDDNDDDDDDDEEEEEDTDENEYDTETSEEGNEHGLGKYGFLVDKSSQNENLEMNNNDDVSTTSILTGKTNDSMELNHLNNDLDHEDGILDHHSNTVTAGQFNQLEVALKSRKEEVEKEMSYLTDRLNRVREDAISEMEKLERELRKRREDYKTEIDEISRHREEQKQKFEEELEEFQNEKKLEERRQRYNEHERIITEKEEELDRRKSQVLEQEREVRDYEEYLNRRHKACNGKEEDLTVLQNELETLARELEAKKERLLNKNRVYQQQLDNVEEPPLPSPSEIPVRIRSPSRVSTASRGVDSRIEELKYQNKQLLEELFTLRKALESKDEEMDEIRQTMDVLESDNKRLLQKVKNLESQLEVARKGAELGSETPNSPVEDILRKTASDLRKSRVSRVSRVHLEPLSLTNSQARIPRKNSKDSVHSKAKSSNSSDSGKEEKSLRSFSKSGSKSSDEKHIVKKDSEKTTSSLCAVM